MRTHTVFGAALAVAMIAAVGAAEPPGCDLKVGDGVGAYSAIKVGGVDDGVKVDKSLCYI